MLAINGGRPGTMNLKEILVAFVAFREEVIRRRTIFELAKARTKAHVLAGLAVAVVNLDEVIALIREAPDPSAARAQLMERAWPAGDVAPLIGLLDEPGHRIVDGGYRLSETQAKAILELRLHRLTGLEREKIAADLRQLGKEIETYLNILGLRDKLFDLLRAEFREIKEKFATPRRTQLVEGEFDQDIEDLIQREDMVVTVTNTGYIKRVALSTYRSQRRGGRGRAGMSTRDEDFVSQVFVVNTHTPVLFFSSTGMVYKLKVFRLPEGSPQARGKAMINLLPIDMGETITTLMPLPEDEESWGDLFVMFATATGAVRRNRLSDFTNVMANGKIAMKLKENDRLVRVRTCTLDDDVLLTTRNGKCIRFPLTDVRLFVGRASVGVRGIRLASGDEVIGMSALKHVAAEVAEREAYLQSVGARRRLVGSDYTGKAEEKANHEKLAARLDEPAFIGMEAEEEFILTISEDGFGKRSSAYEYRVSKRGGKGIASMDLKRADGANSAVVVSFPIIDTDQLVMVSDNGQLIRVPVKDISFVGRTTKGVTLFKMASGEHVVSVTRIRDLDEGTENEDEAGDDGQQATNAAGEGEG